MGNVRSIFTRCVWRKEFFIKKNPTSLLYELERKHFDSIYLRIYDIISTGWKPDQAKFICSVLCLKLFSNIFAKFIPKEQTNELWAEVSYTLVYFCWEEVCICFYLAVSTVTVLLLFLHCHHHSFSCISTNQVSHPTKKIFKIESCLVHINWAAGLRQILTAIMCKRQNNCEVCTPVWGWQCGP